MRALRALGAGVTLGPLPSWRTGIALRTLGTAIPRVTLRALPPVRTSAVLDVAGAVLIHVLGGEVTRAVLVQIPAMQTMSALRALVTLAALRPCPYSTTFRACVSGVTLRPLPAWLARIPLRTLGAAIPPVTPRTLPAGRTSAVLDVAGAVVIHVLDGEVTRAVLVQIPAMQPGSARRALVTLEALRTGVALGALRTGVAFGTLRAGISRRSLRTRITRRTLRSGRTSAIQNRSEERRVGK